MKYEELIFKPYDLNLVQGPEHNSFVAAARAETDTEFVQTRVSEVAEVLGCPPFRAPFLALRKQQPERFSAFGIALGYVGILVELRKGNS